MSASFNDDEVGPQFDVDFLGEDFSPQNKMLQPSADLNLEVLEFNAARKKTEKESI
ncbi:hypothetical protein HK096_003019, partial [Nowakowskiella sp. JEL0078]